MATPQRGDFVRVRTRRWLVEDERGVGDGLTALRLACVDDDAQGETVELLWDAELDGSILGDEGWAAVEHGRTIPLPVIRRRRVVQCGWVVWRHRLIAGLSAAEPQRMT